MEEKMDNGDINEELVNRKVKVRASDIIKKLNQFKIDKHFVKKIVSQIINIKDLFFLKE